MREIGETTDAPCSLGARGAARKRRLLCEAVVVWTRCGVCAAYRGQPMRVKMRVGTYCMRGLAKTL